MIHPIMHLIIIQEQIKTCTVSSLVKEADQSYRPLAVAGRARAWFCPAPAVPGGFPDLAIAGRRQRRCRVSYSLKWPVFFLLAGRGAWPISDGGRVEPESQTVLFV